MNFAAAIKAHLVKKGWNQQRLADEAGISKGGVSDVMHSKSSISFVRLIKIADALRVPVWKLVKEAEQLK
jgi:transcriptional regulator with XRE-family HTH domain